MALETYVPPSDRIIHETEVDFVTRDNYGRTVYLVQTTDNKLPIIAVSFYQNGVPYVIPANAEGNVRWKKPDPDRHYVYNPLLGVNAARNVAYIEVTDQMVVTAGRPKAIIELTIGGNTVGSERIPIIIDQNPMNQIDLESTDEMKAIQEYVNDAERSATAADTSAKAAASSASAAKASETAAKNSQTAAANSATAAATSATNAKASETAAKNSQTAAANSATAAATSATNAATSASEAKKSQDAAKTSETNAAASKTAAATSATNAKASEDAAAASKTAAANSASAAKTSQEAAKTSETNAAASKTAAADSASKAATSASNAATSATSANNYAKQSQSYAVGTGGVRENEVTDNAKYYYEQSKNIAQGLEGGLLPMGTVAFAQLNSQTKEAGYMYNISNAFTTDATFREGTGHAYPAGTNVYYTADGYWDCLAGYQVVSVNGQTGAVNITSVTGNAGTATKLAAASSIGISGAVTGTATAFDGSKDITIPTTGIDVSKANAGILAVARGGTGNATGTAAKVANALSFTGGVIGTYDGSKALSVPIPTVSYPVTSVNTKTGAVVLSASDVGALPSGGKAGTAGTADKVGHTLTFSGGSNAKFDGSSDQSVVIPTTLPANGGHASSADTATTAVRLSTRPRVYTVSGRVFSSMATSYGTGFATVILYTDGFAEIHFSAVIQADGSNAGTTEWGLVNSLISGKDGIPLITPMSGGVVNLYTNNMYEPSLTGFGMTAMVNWSASTGNYFWTPARVYDDAGTIGGWVESIVRQGMRFTGAVYGTFDPAKIPAAVMNVQRELYNVSDSSFFEDMEASLSAQKNLWGAATKPSLSSDLEAMAVE